MTSEKALAERPTPTAGGELRWFAGLAMQAIITKQDTVPDTVAEREEISLWAYRMAQAMVEAETRLGLEPLQSE